VNTRFAVLVLFISSAGWGLTWLPIKGLTDLGLNSMHLIFAAFATGAIILLPWLIKQFSQWKLSIKFLLMIAFTGGLANAAFQTAIAHGEVVRVMILFYMLPVWSVVGGRIFLKEKIDLIRMIAVTLCLAGAFIILDVWHASWKGISWVDVLAIISGMALAATNILFRYTQTVPVMSKVSVMFIGCTLLVSVPMVIFTSGDHLPDNNAIFYAMLYGGIYLTLITIGTQWAVTQMEAGRSAVIIVVELVVAVVSAAMLLHTDLMLFEVFGGIMVLVAALLEGLREEREMAVA
jgi:drug/metabolite transporter (DMT)-like permease